MDTISFRTWHSLNSYFETNFKVFSVINLHIYKHTVQQGKYKQGRPQQKSSEADATSPCYRASLHFVRCMISTSRKASKLINWKSSISLHFLEELFNPNPHPKPLTTHNQCNINVCQIMEIHVNKENYYARHTKQPGVLWFLFTLKLLAVWQSVFKTIEWRCLDNTNCVYFHTDQTLWNWHKQSQMLC